jgi:hypothetical protein
VANRGASFASLHSSIARFHAGGRFTVVPSFVLHAVGSIGVTGNASPPFFTSSEADSYRLSHIGRESILVGLPTNLTQLNLREKHVTAKSQRKHSDAKIEQLARDTEDGVNQPLSSNQGIRINDDQNSLKAGERGGTLMEDFLLREKITHFDHERIPERIVHARGPGAHAFFQKRCGYLFI